MNHLRDVAIQHGAGGRVHLQQAEALKDRLGPDPHDQGQRRQRDPDPRQALPVPRLADPEEADEDQGSHQEPDDAAPRHRERKGGDGDGRGDSEDHPPGFVVGGPHPPLSVEERCALLVRLRRTRHGLGSLSSARLSPAMVSAAAAARPDTDQERRHHRDRHCQVRREVVRVDKGSPQPPRGVRLVAEDALVAAQELQQAIEGNERGEGGDAGQKPVHLEAGSKTGDDQIEHAGIDAKQDERLSGPMIVQRPGKEGQPAGLLHRHGRHPLQRPAPVPPPGKPDDHLDQEQEEKSQERKVQRRPVPADLALGDCTPGPAQKQSASDEDGRRQAPACDAAEDEGGNAEQEKEAAFDHSIHYSCVIRTQVVSLDVLCPQLR